MPIRAERDRLAIRARLAQRWGLAPRGVRGRLVLLALVIIVPAFLFAAAVLLRFVQSEEDGIRARGLELARISADEVDQDIVAARALLVGLSTTGALRDGDHKALYAQAADAAQRYGEPIGFVDAEGNRRFITAIPYGHPLPPHSAPDLIARTLRTGRTQISNLIPAPSRGGFAVILQEPAMVNGAVAGLFGIEIDVARVIARIAANRLPEAWLVAILDRNGTIIARSRAAEQYVGTPATADLRASMAAAPTGTAYAETKEGQRVFTAYTQTRLSGWTVVIGVPESVVQAPLRGTMQDLAISGLVLGTLAVGAALVVARGISRPMLALAGLADDLGRGRPAPSEFRATGLREADRIGRSLRRAIADLDERARERDAAEAQLRRRNAELRSILDTVPDAMVIFDAAGIIRSFSATAERMFGWPAEEACGRSVGLLLPSHMRDGQDGGLARHARTGTGPAIGMTMAVEALRRDGTVFPAETCVGRIEVAGETFFTGFIRDLTERRATEQRVQELQADLMHAARLSAMGQVVSTIAHELNQPLAAVVNYLAVARMLDGTPAAQDAVAQALGQAERASDTVRRIRAFAAKRVVERRAEGVRAIVEDACALGLVGFRGTGIGLRVAVEPDCPPVLADRVQIQQVLVNLIRNAAESMSGASISGAGRRELAVSATYRPPARTGSPEAGVVEFAVADTGGGLAEGISERLFTPFQTTKGTGMGIGLSVSRSIVEAHEGRIWAEANPGGGTLFRFTIPAVVPEGRHHDA